MRVIDLLNKIANGEEVPKHIHIRDVDNYTWQEDVKAYWSDRDENDMLSDLDLSTTDLKEEIEIIGDKKIRKITLLGEEIKLGSLSNWLKDSTNNEEKIASCIECNAMKINEIIDYINGGTNGE